MNGLLDYLASESATKADEKDLPHCKQSRWTGPNQDTLTINVFNNHTVQFQGKHAHLATLIWDYLINVLSLEDTLKKQIETYDINITVSEIKDELAARIPASCGYIAESVRKQLSSSIALCKVNLPLEDFGAIAFPALRGLEGFIKQVLISGGLKPGNKDSIGGYFEQKVVDMYVLSAVNSSYVGQPRADILATSYTLYKNQRHGLFHMDATPETSRILGSMHDAQMIVQEVLDNIEKACIKLLS
ncbi:MAG: type II toxin-antitoxin system RnlA family toxin [Proteobacteria bacterium]|nr:type II toxin-antitoxin system RnlA family toxin [Pseudomonadota bacterium]